MRKNTLVALAAALAGTGGALLPAAAQAQLAFNVGAVSDYRYRGISQTRLKPAAQGGVDYTAGGLYIGAWASTIKWIKDAGGDADVEIDVYGGYKGQITKDLGYDVGVLTYVYPSNKFKSITGTSADTTEIYGALTFGPATLKYSHSVTNLFGTPDSKNSGYFDLSATFDVAGLSVVPHVGYTKVHNYSSLDYTDYSLTVSKDFSGLVLSGAIVGADLDVRGPNNKRLDKTSLVVGLKYNF
jgi:uncharacterized protein (TIGR02001 family)